MVRKCATGNLRLLNWVSLDQPPADLLQHRDTWQLLSKPLKKDSIMKCLTQCLPVLGERVNFEQLSAEVVKTFFFGLSVSVIEMDSLSTDKVFRLSCQSPL